MKHILIAVVVFALAVGSLPVFPTVAVAQGEDYTLTIVHTNDVHARVEQFTKYGSSCGEQDAADGNCFGGVARRVTELEKIRAEGGNMVLIDAGDQFQGTLFFIEYKGKAAQQFMNQMNYQAMAVGNHEFDDGPSVLAEFIKGVNFPVLSANIDASQDPDLAGLIQPYTILEAGGEQIGVIGCTTEETPLSSSPGPTIVFNDVQQSVAAAVLELEAKGIDKIVVLSHIGYLADQDLAAAVDGIDVIVGGHSHTLLSNTAEGAAGPYPTVVDSPSGDPVLVVQDGAWGMYLGRLDVTFDGAGVATAWEGDPILLDASIAEDADTLAAVEKLDAPLDVLQAQVIGQAAVMLDGERTTCRFEECNLGDLITDAMVDATESEGTEIAILNGGSIRTSIPAGEVSWGAVLDVLPFGNTIATFELSGADVWLALENGVSRAENPENEGTGRFPQVSGVRFTWNPTLPAGSRVVSVDVLQADGGYQPIDPNRSYKVASNTFMRGGGDGYSVFAEKAVNAYDFGPVVADAVAAYISQNSPVTAAVEGRITRDETASPPETLPATGSSAGITPWIMFLVGAAVLGLGLRRKRNLV
jgi:5'-nucleotidase / UDP-sugar diphosphatase